MADCTLDVFAAQVRLPGTRILLFLSPNPHAHPPKKEEEAHTNTHTYTHTHTHTHTLASCNVDLQKPNTEEPNAYCVYVQHLVVKLKRASSQKSAVCVFYSLSRIINETVQKCKTYNFSSFTQTGTPVAVTYDPNLLKPTVNARCWNLIHS